MSLFLSGVVQSGTLTFDSGEMLVSVISLPSRIPVPVCTEVGFLGQLILMSQKRQQAVEPLQFCDGQHGVS
jgi:ABC-type transport system involved in cytochrome c biogenesis permease component